MPGHGVVHAMVIERENGNYTWGDFKYDATMFGYKMDRWAEGWGKSMGKFIVSYHPGISLANAYGAYTDDTDIYMVKTLVLPKVLFKSYLLLHLSLR